MSSSEVFTNHCACGVGISRFAVRCEDCANKHIIEAATVVEPSGPLNVVGGETFFFDLAEASEFAAGQYAHPCDEVPLHINPKRMTEDLAERVVEDMCEEAHEDAENQVEGLAELKAAFEAALDAFNKAQTSCSWMPRPKEVFQIPALAAGSGTAETNEDSAQCGASQSGGEAVTPKGISNA